MPQKQERAEGEAPILRLDGGGAGIVVLFAGQVLSVYGDAQLAKEAEIVLGEGYAKLEVVGFGAQGR